MFLDIQIPMRRVEGGSIVRQLEVARMFNRHKVELHDFKPAQTCPGAWQILAVFDSTRTEAEAIELFPDVAQSLCAGLNLSELAWKVWEEDALPAA